MYNVTDCPEGRSFRKVGCVMLTSYINQGEVKCVGDGVDETIRYPPVGFGKLQLLQNKISKIKSAITYSNDNLEPGRPFFVERGNKLIVMLAPDAGKVKIPCLTNSEVATSVFLYRKTENVRCKYHLNFESLLK